MQPTIYSYRDEGAPVFKLSANVEEMATSVFALLESCFVTGYGNKLPPGSGLSKWQIAQPDSSSVKLILGDTGQPLECVLSGFRRVDRHHTVSGFTNIMPFEFEVSLGSSSSVAYEIPWYIIATERGAYFQFGYGAIREAAINFDDAASSSNMNNGNFYIGDYVSIDGINKPAIIASIPQTYWYNRRYHSYYSFALSDSNSSSSYVRRYALVGDSPEQVDFLTIQPIRGARPKSINNITGSPTYYKPWLVAGGKIIGHLPGLNFTFEQIPCPCYWNPTYITDKNMIGFGTHGETSYYIDLGEWGID